MFNNKRFEDSKNWETTASDYSYLHFSAGGSIKLNDFSLNPVIVYRSIPNSPNLFSGTVGLSFKEKIDYIVYEDESPSSINSKIIRKLLTSNNYKLIGRLNWLDQIYFKIY